MPTAATTSAAAIADRTMRDRIHDSRSRMARDEATQLTTQLPVGRAIGSDTRTAVSLPSYEVIRFRNLLPARLRPISLQVSRELLLMPPQLVHGRVVLGRVDRQDLHRSVGPVERDDPIVGHDDHERTKAGFRNPVF